MDPIPIYQQSEEIGDEYAAVPSENEPVVEPKRIRRRMKYSTTTRYQSKKGRLREQTYQHLVDLDRALQIKERAAGGKQISVFELGFEADDTSTERVKKGLRKNETDLASLNLSDLGGSPLLDEMLQPIRGNEPKKLHKNVRTADGSLWVMGMKEAPSSFKDPISVVGITDSNLVSLVKDVLWRQIFLRGRENTVLQVDSNKGFVPDIHNRQDVMIMRSMFLTASADVSERTCYEDLYSALNSFELTGNKAENFTDRLRSESIFFLSKALSTRNITCEDYATPPLSSSSISDLSSKELIIIKILQYCLHSPICPLFTTAECSDFIEGWRQEDSDKLSMSIEILSRRSHRWISRGLRRVQKGFKCQTALVLEQTCLERLTRLMSTLYHIEGMADFVDEFSSNICQQKFDIAELAAKLMISADKATLSGERYPDVSVFVQLLPLLSSISQCTLSQILTDIVRSESVMAILYHSAKSLRSLISTHVEPEELMYTCVGRQMKEVDAFLRPRIAKKTKPAHLLRLALDHSDISGENIDPLNKAAVSTIADYEGPELGVLCAVYSTSGRDRLAVHRTACYYGYATETVGKNKQGGTVLIYDSKEVPEEPVSVTTAINLLARSET